MDPEEASLEKQIKDACKFIEPGSIKSPSIIVSQGGFIGEPDTEDYRWAQYAYVVDKSGYTYKTNNGIVYEYCVANEVPVRVSRKEALRSLWREVIEPRFIQTIQEHKAKENIHTKRLRERMEEFKDLDPRARAKMEHKFALQIEYSTTCRGQPNVIERYDTEKGFIQENTVQIKQAQPPMIPEPPRTSDSPVMVSRSEIESKVKHWKQHLDKEIAEHEAKVNSLVQYELDIIIHEDDTRKRLTEQHHYILASLRSSLVAQLDVLLTEETAEALWERKSAETQAALEAKITSLETALQAQDTAMSQTNADFQTTKLLLLNAEDRIRKFERDAIPLFLKVSQLNDSVSDHQTTLNRKDAEIERIKAEKEDICMTLSVFTAETDKNLASQNILRDRVSDLERLCKDLESKNDCLKEENCFMEQLSDERAEEINELMARLEARQGEALEHVSEIQALKDEVESLKASESAEPVEVPAGDANEPTRDAEALENVITELRRLLEVRTENCRQLESELAQLAHGDMSYRENWIATKTSMETTIANLTSRNKKLEEGRETLMQNIAINAEDVASLRASLAGEQATRAQSEEKAAVLESAVKKLEESRKTLLQNITINAEDVAALQASLAVEKVAAAQLARAADEKCETLRSEYGVIIGKLEREIAALKDEHTAERGRMDQESFTETEFHDNLVLEKEEKISRLSAGLDEAQNLSKQHLDQCSALEKELARVQAELDEMKGFVTGYREERAQLLKEQAKHNRTVNKLKQHIEDQEQALAEMSQSNSRNCTQIDSLREQLARASDCDTKAKEQQPSPLEFYRSSESAGFENYALADYQRQLMILEVQNKKRLLKARKEQDRQLANDEAEKPKQTPKEYTEDAPCPCDVCEDLKCEDGTSCVAKSVEDFESKSAVVEPAPAPIVQANVTLQPYYGLSMVLEEQKKSRMLAACDEKTTPEGGNPVPFLRERLGDIAERMKRQSCPCVAPCVVHKDIRLEAKKDAINELSESCGENDRKSAYQNKKTEDQCEHNGEVEENEPENEPEPAPEAEPASPSHPLQEYQRSLMVMENQNVLLLRLLAAEREPPSDVDQVRALLQSLKKRVEFLIASSSEDHGRIVRGQLLAMKPEAVGPSSQPNEVASLQEQIRAMKEKWLAHLQKDKAGQSAQVEMINKLRSKFAQEEAAHKRTQLELLSAKSAPAQKEAALVGDVKIACDQLRICQGHLEDYRLAHAATLQQLADLKAKNEELVKAEEQAKYQAQLAILESQGCKRMMSCMREKDQISANSWHEREERLKELEGQLSACQQDRDALRQRITESEQQSADALKRANITIQELGSVVHALRKDHGDAVEKITELESRVEQLSASSLSLQCEELESERLKLIVETNRLSDEVGRLEAEQTKLREDLTVSNFRVADLKGYLFDVESAAKDESEQLRARLAADEKEKAETKRKADELDRTSQLLAERTNERDHFMTINEQLLQQSHEEAQELAAVTHRLEAAETEIRELKAEIRSAAQEEPADAQDAHSDIFVGLRKDTGDPPFCGLSNGVTEPSPTRHSEDDEISLSGAESCPSLDKGKAPVPIVTEEVETETKDNEVFQDANSDHDSTAAADGSQHGTATWTPSEAQRRVMGITGMQMAAANEAKIVEEEGEKVMSRRASISGSEDSFELV